MVHWNTVHRDTEQQNTGTQNTSDRRVARRSAATAPGAPAGIRRSGQYAGCAAAMRHAQLGGLLNVYYRRAA
jgi:hypothetical protein